MSYYILDGKKAKQVDSVTEWALWFEKADRKVKVTELPNGVKVSTIFLGLDHGWNGIVLIFETMIFGGEHDQYQDRYGTWEEAERGHEKAIELVYS